MEMLTHPPILAYPDFDLPFILHTYASSEFLGAVLYQHQGKLEFLALNWAICDKFRDYLYNASTFTVFSENNPLTYILSTARLNAAGHCWVGELPNFHFDIHYRPGKANVDADTLSRYPVDFTDHLNEYTGDVS